MDVSLQLQREAARRRRLKLLPNIAVTALIVVLCFYFIGPLIWLLFASTKAPGGLYSSPSLWFDSNFRLWQNITHVLSIYPTTFSFWFITFDAGEFIVWLTNSLLYTIPTVILSAVVGSAAGYGLAKYQFKGRTALLFIVILSLVFPGGTLVIPTFLVGSALHLLDNPLGVILPQVANAFGVVVFYNFFSHQFSTEIVHAARIDGANEYRIFATIAIPAARAVLTTLSIFAFVASWNNYFLPTMMAPSNERKPLAVGLVVWASQTNLVGNAGTGGNSTAGTGYIGLNDIITGAMLVTLPVIILFVLLRRYWASGFEGGSLKG